jgi:Fe2+ transport system protein FeoA
MRRLVDVEPETQTTIRKIEGGEDIKKHLEDLGVNQNEEIRVLEQARRHEHTGAVSLSVDDREVILGHGMADKLYVDKEGDIISLLELEEEDKGIIRAFGGGKDLAEWFSALDIKTGKEVKFLRHLPDDTLSFEVRDNPVTMGEGRASKILAEHEGKSIQINYLKTGEKAKVDSIIGGTSLKEEFEQQGIKEGADIIMTGRDETVPAPVKRKYVRAETGGQQITIGYGMAKKVWVD